MDKTAEYLDLLKREVVPAIGCTEPIAVAYAVCKGTEVLGKLPEMIELNLSVNVIKNALGVGIPGTGMYGINIAAALGAVCNNSNLGLQLLSELSEEQMDIAKSMVKEERIKIKVSDTEEKLYIEAICKYKNNFSRVIIKNEHTKIVYIEHNHIKIFDSQKHEVQKENSHGAEELSVKSIMANDNEDSKYIELDKEFLNGECAIGDKLFSIEGIYNFAVSVDFEDIKFLLNGAEMNKKVSNEGLNRPYGLEVGNKISKSTEFNPLGNNLINKIVAATAAASDARMSGCKLPIMTTAGSGNQGITCIIPSVVLAEELGKSEEELARALAISSLITIYIKSYMGRLSPICGAGIAASTGASAAMTYLLGGNIKNIKCAIKNMLADVSGIICDGAKSTCALKIATAVNAAIQCSILAMSNIEPCSNDGIINDDVEKTIENIGSLVNKGFDKTDKAILEIMLNK